MVVYVDIFTHQNSTGSSSYDPQTLISTRASSQETSSPLYLSIIVFRFDATNCPPPTSSMPGHDCQRRSLDSCLLRVMKASQRSPTGSHLKAVRFLVSVGKAVQHMKRKPDSGLVGKLRVFCRGVKRIKNTEREDQSSRKNINPKSLFADVFRENLRIGHGEQDKTRFSEDNNVPRYPSLFSFLAEIAKPADSAENSRGEFNIFFSSNLLLLNNTFDTQNTKGLGCGARTAISDASHHALIDLISSHQAPWLSR